MYSRKTLSKIIIQNGKEPLGTRLFLKINAQGVTVSIEMYYTLFRDLSN